MYVIPLTAPLYMDGTQAFVGTDWKRSLELLRDSLEGRYGPVVFAAPISTIDDTAQTLERIDPGQDDIHALPLFEATSSSLDYWRHHHRPTLKKMADALGENGVMHGTVADPLRPFCYAAVMAATRKGLPTLLVIDQDDAKSMQELVAEESLTTRLKAKVMARIYEHQTFRATRAADLCFFKGNDTVQKYGPRARTVLPIEDTSYLEAETTPEHQIRARLKSLQTGKRSLRFVFCGRLIALKGLDRSLSLIAQARTQGANIGFDIIGSGPQEAALRQQANDLGIAQAVTFHGSMKYGPALLSKMAESDALLFNPRISETPRMVFDAYAAGLPVIADDIEYIRERRDAEGATIALPWNDDATAIQTLLDIDKNREQLVPLTENALKARLYHAADRWYQRRAEATHEMVAHLRGNTS